MKNPKPTNKRRGKLNSDQETFEKIGSGLKSLRIAAGYKNGEKFAEDNSITGSQYTSWERGQNMKISSLLRVLAIHNITLSEFFSRYVSKS